MEPYRLMRNADGSETLEVPYAGAALLHHPLYNKSTAFSYEEREELGLTGLLPEAVSTMEQQDRRVTENIARKSDPLERYIGLAALQDRNEQLFYRVLLGNLEEYLPIVYTPTVGRACQDYSHIFRRARGLWITPRHRGHIDRVLANAPFADVRLIVVTDNERILGLGDQGAGGMGIPIGKLALYTAAAGIAPWQTLPISLDVGTDNKQLLEDDLYLGWRHPRLRGEEYDSLVAEFVDAVRLRFPHAVLQWEDFKKGTAFRLLERYRAVLPSFNDDIQGTAAVSLAAVMAAERITGTPIQKERVVVLGGGAAGIGISTLLREAMQRGGLAGEELKAALAVLDSRGLLVEGDTGPDAYKQAFAWPKERVARMGLSEKRDLMSVVKALKPTVLIGTSGEPGTFPEDLVREVARHVERPMILPLSNPTANSEAVPEDLMRWTDGRALVATGSPFAPVNHKGKVHVIGQANNVFVFPAVGLASIVGQVRQIPDALFAVAAHAVAAQVEASDLESGRLLPRVRDLRPVTRAVATAVLEEALRLGIATPPKGSPAEAIRAAMWEPRYPRFRKV